MRALAMYASELERAGLTAHQCNPYVIDYLLGCKRIPHGQSDSIGLGDESEAIAYALENRDTKTKNVIIYNNDVEGMSVS